MEWDSVDRRHMAEIRPIPGVPTQPLHFTKEALSPHCHTIASMQSSGFHVWNFLIIRATSYGGKHDQRWASYLSAMRSDAEGFLAPKLSRLPEPERPPILISLVRWDVLEDRDTLERASVENVRKAFQKWREGTCVERDGEGANHLFVRLGLIARFRHFVMVDDESLASMPDLELEGDAAARQDRLRRLPPAKVRVVDAGRPEGVEKLYGGGPRESPPRSGDPAGEDADAEDGDEDEDEYDDEEVEGSVHEEVEGCTDWDVGWMWVEVRFLLVFYEEMQAESEWDLTYERPPKVYGR